MTSTSNRKLLPQLRATQPLFLATCALILCVAGGGTPAQASDDAPAWMHALTTVPLPPHDENTNAVLMYSERNVTVVSVDKLVFQVRQAYRVLRPGGREYGDVRVTFNSSSKVTTLHGWCIPIEGKDFGVKDKEAIEIAVSGIEGSDLVSDVREKFIHIPAAAPGSVVGYEYTIEEHPMVLQDDWAVQQEIPSKESRYSLHLPAGWEYRASWINHEDVKPIASGAGQWQWTLSDLAGIRREVRMPPMEAVAARMMVTLLPPGGDKSRGLQNWQEMGTWYTSLASGRRDLSPELKQKTITLATPANTTLDKMRAIAQFMQDDIRYVAIELGVGGFQPHPATDVFTHRYGDCKDKATLMSAMLHEIGIDSYYVLINTERGAVGLKAPVDVYSFNHAILAIQLPVNLKDPSLVAVVENPLLGRLLYVDPTNEMVPFGQIGGYLQANYGLLVAPTGGELVLLPRQPASMSGVSRTAKLSLDSSGKLSGQVTEIRVGDRASAERFQLRTVSNSAEQIKPIETLLADSLANSRVTHASITNLKNIYQPFSFDFGFEASGYAKSTGELMLVRPRVMGRKSEGLLETKEPRLFPIEFSVPMLDADTFEITVPGGYQVDDLPPPVDAEYSFASYHSKSEVKGNVIRYTRTYEQKELSVPAAKSEELKKFYRTIAADERNTAVLMSVAK